MKNNEERMKNGEERRRTSMESITKMSRKHYGSTSAWISSESLLQKLCWTLKLNPLPLFIGERGGGCRPEAS